MSILPQYTQIKKAFANGIQDIVNLTLYVSNLICTFDPIHTRPLILCHPHIISLSQNRKSSIGVKAFIFKPHQKTNVHFYTICIFTKRPFIERTKARPARQCL